MNIISKLQSKPMKKFNVFRIKAYIKLYKYLYGKISRIASKINNNIHPKHRLMNYHQFFIDNIETNSNILDIGCGKGSLTYDLAKKARKVVAIDFDKNSIQIAIKRFNKDNIRYIVGDATKYKFEEIFDYIILSNVLEHIKNRSEFLNKVKKLGNYILIRVPMINRSWLPLYIKELGLDYKLDQTHFIEYTFDTFQEEMESTGLKILNYSIQFGEIWAKIGPN